MARAPKMAKEPAALKLPKPEKVVRAPPRLKPTSTREYGKGGTPLSGAPDQGQSYGGEIGYGGPDGL